MVRAVVLAYGRVDAVELVAVMYEVRRLLVKTPDPETERAEYGEVVPKPALPLSRRVR